MAVWRRLTTECSGIQLLDRGWIHWWLYERVCRPTCTAFTPIYNLLNGLTECYYIDHGNRYFDNAYFGTQFKAFHNLGAEWQAWVHVKVSQGEVRSGVDHPQIMPSQIVKFGS